MLITDMLKVGTKLYEARKRAGFSQADVAELAGISDRAYADIERGTSNMRAGTLLRICAALKITPDEIFTEPEPIEAPNSDTLFERLSSCSLEEYTTALKLLDVYLSSVGK